MFGLSTIWLRVIGGAIVLGALLFGLWRVYHAGYDARDTEAKLQMSQALLHAAKKTDEIRVEFDALKAKSAKERKNAAQEINRLRVAVDDGTLVLSVPAPTSGSGPTSARAGNPEARTELDRSTAASLVGLAADGDAAIRDLNSCVDSYNALKEKINGQRTD